MSETIVQIPPVPRERRGLRLFRDVRADPLGYFENLAIQEGAYAVVRFPDIKRFPGITSIMLNDAASVEHIFNDKEYDRKGIAADFLAPLMSKGLLFSWRKHRDQRMIAQPYFMPRPRDHADMLTQMVAASSDMLDRWQAQADKGKPLDLTVEFPRMTFDVLLRALFHETGSERAAEMQSALGVILDKANEYMWQMAKPPVGLYYYLPKYRDAAKTLGNAADEMIARRREALKNPNFEHREDLLSQFVNHYEPAKKDQRQELRHNILAFLLAGHETTAHSLTFTTIFLTQNPHIQQRMRAEVDSVLGNSLPSLENVRSLPLTGHVFDESLRLRPPISLLQRIAPHDDLIPLDDGRKIEIPKDHPIMLAPWVVHRLKKYWDNPETFDPDRFSPERSIDRKKGAFFPFAGGPRICIGERFARLESLIALAMITQKFDLSIINPDAIRPHYAITLRPDRPVMATVKPREPYRAAA